MTDNSWTEAHKLKKDDRNQKDVWYCCRILCLLVITHDYNYSGTREETSLRLDLIGRYECRIEIEVKNTTSFLPFLLISILLCIMNVHMLCLSIVMKVE